MYRLDEQNVSSFILEKNYKLRRLKYTYIYLHMYRDNNCLLGIL
jgi:hypothetical protein